MPKRYWRNCKAEHDLERSLLKQAKKLKREKQKNRQNEAKLKELTKARQEKEQQMAAKETELEEMKQKLADMMGQERKKGAAFDRSVMTVLEQQYQAKLKQHDTDESELKIAKADLAARRVYINQSVSSYLTLQRLIPEMPNKYIPGSILSGRKDVFSK